MRLLLAKFTFLVVACCLPALAEKRCEDLASLQLKNTTITSAQLVAAGAFTSPAGAPEAPGAPGYKTVPAFCRVVADVRPSKDSDIKVEVWMPATGWNGKFQGQGNGGFAGAIDYRGLASAVGRGYATAGTDTGHKGDATDATWAPGHPEKIVDFGYRGIHEMSEKAKAVVVAFYGKAPRQSYFSSLLRRRPRSSYGSAALSRWTMTELLPGRPPTSGPIWSVEPPGTTRIS